MNSRILNSTNPIQVFCRLFCRSGTRLISVIDGEYGRPLQYTAPSPPIFTGLFPCSLVIDDDFEGLQLPPCRALPQHLDQLV